MALFDQNIFNKEPIAVTERGVKFTTDLNNVVLTKEEEKQFVLDNIGSNKKPNLINNLIIIGYRSSITDSSETCSVFRSLSVYQRHK